MFLTKNITGRVAYERALRIDSELRAHHHVSKRELAAILEVAPRTVQRDLEFLRDRMRRPLAYDAAQRAYCYTERVTPLGDVHLTDRDLRALVTAKSAQMPAASTGDSMLAAIALSLPHQTAERLARLQGAFYFKPFGEAIMSPEIFDALLTAVIDSAEVRFGYDKLAHREHETRVAQPLTLCCIDRMWYLLARDRMRNALRTFALPRISDLSRTGRFFRRPRRFSTEKHLAESFGLITGEKLQLVSIRFDAFAGRLVRERMWHHSQKIEELPDGTCLMTIWVGRFEEIERWILSWGEHARVLLPVELVTRVKHSILSMKRQYADSES
jgi:proteasome accessory factor B